MAGDERIAAAKRIATYLAERVGADLSIELWNGEVVPLGVGARDDIRIRIAHPDVVRRILLKPRLMTVYALYASGDIDIVGGTPLEAIERWDHMKALGAARGLSKWWLVKNLLPFLFSRREVAAIDAGNAYTASVAAKPEAGRDDKELISFHYDVSNEFFGLFLDPEMVYSSAYFRDDTTTLEEAQILKLDMICRRLRLKPGEKLLDIGCGWGGLICHAVTNYGVTAHGVTLSQKQFDFVTAKLARLGIADKVRLELKDYREIEGAEVYDKIAQIEMFEHVGLDNHDRHFLHMHKLLKPRGLYLHQASVRRATRNLSEFRRQTAYMKFITTCIFPGGELDHIGLTITNLERLGFEVHDVENWREHFSRTTRLWSERLAANRAAAEAEVGAAKTRLWLAYFAMTTLGFRRGPILVYQTLASKRRSGPSGLPWTREDLYR
ncbi:MAG: cyclopropane-fatty-acyl-phospholipid synthase family protein [Siculibacillus sp.]|nr:cyclopropane-fatty-acyl-phospholipid synthase family protein [Siculibacillus sp.]